MNTTSKLLKPNFECPHCKVNTQHQWRGIVSKSIPKDPRESSSYYSNYKGLNDFKISICYNCNELIMWHSENPIFPNTLHQPEPNAEMPDSIKSIYKEAASISRLSPRASCALMRHALEELLKIMGYDGDLFDDIGQMHKEGLIDDTIRDSLDIVRLTGNDAVHSNQIDMNDETNVDYMFNLINEIVESLIAAPKRKKEMLEKFGENKINSIKNRDSK